MIQDQNNPAYLIDFFRRYRSFAAQIGVQFLVEAEQAFGGLIKRFVEERPKAMEAERQVASRYNLFSILKLNFSEVRLHTPILANLLNPVGSHAQGLLFYELFVRKCVSPNRQELFLKVAPYELIVSSEARNPYGQIDILLYSCNPQNRFALIIENKIWAGDQFRQLYRYYSYAKEALGLEPHQICVVYLKPVKGDPDISCLEAEEKAELDKVLETIGYREHIVPILNESLAAISSERVKQTVHQYLLTLQSLAI